jgi:hydrogenase nickel incorporation protein HypA/HybF
MTSVLEVALEYAELNNVKKIRAINLTLGALSDIVPNFAQKFFDYISKDTIAENAKINIQRVPARIACRSCGAETDMETKSLSFSCIECGSKDIKLISGREFSIASIEVE